MLPYVFYYWLVFCYRSLTTTIFEGKKNSRFFLFLSFKVNNVLENSINGKLYSSVLHLQKIAGKKLWYYWYYFSLDDFFFEKTPKTVVTFKPSTIE